jgi:hypothetical protein
MAETVIGPIDTIYKNDSIETVATDFNPSQRTSDIENNMSEFLLRENKVKRKCLLLICCCVVFVIFAFVFVIIVAVLKLF